jgi:hypothetical protein
MNGYAQTDQIVHTEYVQFILINTSLIKLLFSANKTFCLKPLWHVFMIHSSLRCNRQREARKLRKDRLFGNVPPRSKTCKQTGGDSKADQEAVKLRPCVRASLQGKLVTQNESEFHTFS